MTKGVAEKWRGRSHSLPGFERPRHQTRQGSVHLPSKLFKTSLPSLSQPWRGVAGGVYESCRTAYRMIRRRENRSNKEIGDAIIGAMIGGVVTGAIGGALPMYP